MKRIVLYPFFRLPGNGRAFFFTSPPPLKKKDHLRTWGKGPHYTP